VQINEGVHYVCLIFGKNIKGGNDKKMTTEKVTQNGNKNGKMMLFVPIIVTFPFFVTLLCKTFDVTVLLSVFYYRFSVNILLSFYIISALYLLLKT
jgi:hypothetical protein